MSAEQLRNNLPEFIQQKHNWRDVYQRMAQESKEFKEVPDVAPRIYQLEPTNVCNLECIMCPRPGMNRSLGYMNPEVFKTVVERDLVTPQAIELFGFGESTLHPQLPEMIKFLKDNGHYVVLATNGTMLTRELSKRLIDAGLDFCVLDLDGDCKEVYEAIRVRGGFEKVKSNIEAFLQEKGNCFAVVQTIMMPQTRQTDIQRYKEEWTVKGADEVRVKFLDTFAGAVMVEEAQVINPKNEGRQERTPCPELFYGVDIWQDGSVVPCGRYFDLSYPLGNLKEQSLADIWKGEPAKKLRQVHLERDWGKLKEIGAERCLKCQEWRLTNLRFLNDVTNNMFRGGFV